MWTLRPDGPSSLGARHGGHATVVGTTARRTRRRATPSTGSSRRNVSSPSSDRAGWARRISPWRSPRLPDAVVVVRLESVTDPAGAVAVLAGALGSGVSPGPTSRRVDRRAPIGGTAAGSGRQLRTCWPTPALIADLLDRCPETRPCHQPGRLGLPLEHMFRLAPLDVPTADDHHSVESGLVELFVDRARALVRGFAHSRRVGRRGADRAASRRFAAGHRNRRQPAVGFERG